MGEKPVDGKSMLRGILSIGKQDLVTEHLVPVGSNIKILGSCSDEMILDLSNTSGYKTGDMVSFLPEYGALMSGFARVFINRIYE